MSWRAGELADALFGFAKATADAWLDNDDLVCTEGVKLALRAVYGPRPTPGMGVGPTVTATVSMSSGSDFGATTNPDPDPQAKQPKPAPPAWQWNKHGLKYAGWGNLQFAACVSECADPRGRNWKDIAQSHEVNPNTPYRHKTEIRILQALPMGEPRHRFLQRRFGIDQKTEQPPESYVLSVNKVMDLASRGLIDEAGHTIEKVWA